MSKEEKQPTLPKIPLTSQQKHDLAVENVREKSGNFHKLFTSPIGVQVLKNLEDEFDKEEIFREGVPDGTAYNLGRRDVCVYIRQMIRLKENA